VKQSDFDKFDLDLAARLEKKLVWVANNVLQHFVLYHNKEPVSEATILYPMEDGEGAVDGEGFVGVIHDVFERAWAETKGPLNGVQVTVQIVSCSCASTR